LSLYVCQLQVLERYNTVFVFQTWYGNFLATQFLTYILCLFSALKKATSNAEVIKNLPEFSFCYVFQDVL